MIAAPTRSALRYYGGKATLATWIISHFPPHMAYLEPFGGSAAVLVQKPRAALETYNDRDGAVCAFFRVLRDDPAALIRAIQLTPFSREEVDRASIDEFGLTDYERARRLYVRSHQTIHGAPTRENTGWRCERSSGGNVRAWTSVEHLAAFAERLRGVQIENRDGFEVIKRFDTPECLIYADPTYLAHTRGRRWATTSYAFELGTDQHVMLASVLKNAAGMVAISGYASPLYDELYPASQGWLCVTTETRMQSHGAATECLWLSPRLVERLPVREVA